MLEFDDKKIEKIIHYSFKDKNLLKLAFTHSSFANQFNTLSNERLEFLGDSILNYIITDALYKTYSAPEGQLSKWRAKMVNSDNLSNIVSSLGLDKFILLGKSFKEGATKSIKENLFETITAAIYLDSSMEKAKRFVLRFIDVENEENKQDIDFKSKLQEEVQKVRGSNLVYFTYENPKEKGNFCAEVYINDIFISRAFGKTKKNAQMECAKQALQDKNQIKNALK